MVGRDRHRTGERHRRLREKGRRRLVAPGQPQLHRRHRDRSRQTRVQERGHHPARNRPRGAARRRRHLAGRGFRQHRCARCHGLRQPDHRCQHLVHYRRSDGNRLARQHRQPRSIRSHLDREHAHPAKQRPAHSAGRQPHGAAPHPQWRDATGRRGSQRGHPSRADRRHRHDHAAGRHPRARRPLRHRRARRGAADMERGARRHRLCGAPLDDFRRTLHRCRVPGFRVVHRHPGDGRRGLLLRRRRPRCGWHQRELGRGRGHGDRPVVFRSQRHHRRIGDEWRQLQLGFQQLDQDTRRHRVHRGVRPAAPRAVRRHQPRAAARVFGHARLHIQRRRPRFPLDAPHAGHGHLHRHAGKFLLHPAAGHHR